MEEDDLWKIKWREEEEEWREIEREKDLPLRNVDERRR